MGGMEQLGEQGDVVLVLACWCVARSICGYVCVEVLELVVVGFVP